MGYLSLGGPGQLVLEIPTERTENWARRYKDNFVLKLVEHDHSGNGKGVQLGGSALADGSIDGVKFLLKNNQALRAEGIAPSSVLDLFRLNTSDKIVFDTVIESTEIETLNTDTIVVSDKIIGNTVTLDNNGDTTITLVSGKSYRLEYSISDDHVGVLQISATGNVTRRYSDVDYDVDAVRSGTSLDITSTADNLDLVYILKEL